MTKCAIVTDSRQLDQMTGILAGESWLVFDLMTTGTNPEKDRIVGWILGGGENGQVFYVPVGHTGMMEAARQLPADSTAGILSSFISGKPLVGHDLFSKTAFIERLGKKPVISPKSDVMVEAYIQGTYPTVDLPSLIEVFREGKPTTEETSVETMSIEEASAHASERAYCIRKIHLELFPKIMDDRRLRRLHRLEMGVLPIAADIQKVGLRIDFDKCRAEYSRLIEESERLNQAMHGWLQRNFGISTRIDFASSPQTASLLIDRLNILKEVKTAKGNRSTSKKNFDGMRASSPIVNAMFTYRELVKAASGFYGLYPRFEGPDGRIHPRLLTCHVISGRTASADPNCQQIPKETTWSFVDFDDPTSDVCVDCAEGCKVCDRVAKKTITSYAREVFIPRQEYVFVEADYSQIELMVLAGVSGEPGMLQAFQNGEDLHRKTAALIFGVRAENVTATQRQAAKTTNFRFNYGGGPAGLSAQLGIPLKQAYEISEAYTKAYRMVDAFALKSSRDAADKGYVDTLFGRRRYMDEFNAGDPKTRARGRRLSVNLQIQGGASDIAKIGLLRQDRARRQFDKKHGCATHLCNFVHDSFLWEIPIISPDSGKQAEYLREFVTAMRVALCFDVGKLTGIRGFPRLKADFKTGSNYHSMVSFDH